MIMPEDTDVPALERLMRRPRADRREGLQALVATEFKRALLMSENDELPLDENYFQLGLTSLRAVEVKQRLETDLGCELDTALLFSRSTVRQIVDHLAAVALPGVVPAPGADPPRASSPVDNSQLVDELIADLYES